MKIFRSVEVSVPVVIVGNLTVGGSGKSPLVSALVGLLSGAGYSPGVVSRGYRRIEIDEPRIVDPEDDPITVGDEPLLLRRETGGTSGG